MKGETTMTDFQFKSIIKMVLAIANETDNIEIVRKELKTILTGEEKENEQDKQDKKDK